MTLVPFLTLTLFGSGTYLVLSGQRDPLRRHIAQRIRAMSEGGPAPVAERAKQPRPLADWDRFLLGAIKDELRLVEGTIGLPHVLAFAVVLAIAGATAFWLGSWPWLAGVVAGGLVIGRRAIKFVAERHRKQFLNDFPAYLDRVRKLAEVGNSLEMAMKKALTYAHPRVAGYIAPALKRHEVGMPLATALDVQARQLGITEISQLALVAYVNTRYGGSLRDSMAHIAEVERDRARANLELNALTAEVRASAKVFVALPALVAAAIFSLQPSYIRFFVEDPYGPLILAFCALSIFVGLTIMGRMGRID